MEDDKIKAISIVGCGNLVAGEKFPQSKDCEL